jgi:O-6-methylguanine DNA methyltransferase
MTAARDCERLREQWSVARLPSPGAKAHLATCESCQRWVAEQERLRAAFRGSVPRMPAAFAERLWSRLNRVYAARLSSPLGPVTVAFRDEGVVFVLPGRAEEAERYAEERGLGQPSWIEGQGPRWMRRVARRLEGEDVAVPIDWSGVRPFQRAVLEAAARIPRGQVRPYQWVAAQIGRETAARAVGAALADNPLPLIVPCHRVVRADGRLGRYRFGTEAKRRLLAAEGLDVDRLEADARAGVRFLGSDSTRVVCWPTCRQARRIQAAHRVPFRSAEEAARAGYRPCRVCRPPVPVQPLPR